MNQVTVRPYSEDLDAGIIYSTWPKGAYYGAVEPIEGPKKQWFKRFYTYVRKRLDDSEIRIAALSEDPQVIIGYVVINGHTLEWAYVKEAFRLQGICRLLLLNREIKEIANVTKIGRFIAKKHQIGEQNGRTEDRQAEQGVQRGTEA